MKKTLLLLGCAAAMFAGCSNDETVEVAEKQAIDFTSFVDKSTRAVTDVTTANISEISVYGWRENKLLFDAQSVTKSGTDWTYSPLKYWEPAYTYTFEAIAPKSGTSGVTFTANKAGGKVEFTNNATTDLVYAKPVTRDLTSYTLSTLPAQAKVPFTFGHLLSRVKFTFDNGLDASSNAKITVTDVKITDAYKSGSVTPNTSAAWTVGTDKNLEVPFASLASATNITPGATGDTEHMYLIPASGATYNVSFTYKLEQPVGSSSVSTIYDCTATIPASVAMQSGKSYNFKAKIELKPIEFSVTVTDWEAFGDQTITVN